MDVEAIRAQIPACQRTIYMNTGWSGPSPTSVVEVIKERLEYESYEGPTTRAMLDSGRALQLQARQAAADLLHVSAEEIVLTQNTTDGLNLVLNGLEWREGDEIITCGLEHGSVLVPAYFLQHRYGVRVNVLAMAPAEEHSSILDKVEQALTPRTRMVFISHIQFSTGLRMPAEGIRQLTRDRGVLMLLDAAQAAGHIALDLAEMGCEFYSIPGQKWLLGPDGTGALYIRQDMVPQVRPSRVSSHATLSYDHEGGMEENVDSIEKYLLTTTSAALWAGFIEAIRFNREAGPTEIEERVLALAALTKKELLQIPGVSVLSPLEGPGCSGLVSFEVDGIPGDEVVKHLWDAKRIVARGVAVPPCVRLSLCYFNTEEEVRQVAGAIRELAAKHV